jgi:hypothetical protein
VRLIWSKVADIGDFPDWHNYGIVFLVLGIASFYTGIFGKMKVCYEKLAHPGNQYDLFGQKVEVL